MSNRNSPNDIWARYRVDRETGCWNWLGAKNNLGYGQISLNGRTTYVHRVAYELSVGSIADGLVVDHICHNTSCLNPEHLRAVTILENQRNRAGANRNSKSGVRGVSPSGAGWVAGYGYLGRWVEVGYFTCIEDAELALTAARKTAYS